jgi:hypothetical protein
MAVCNKTGVIAVYNAAQNLFLSPLADGPLLFEKDLNNQLKLQTVSKYGRSFSILKIPYSLKLLIQELQTMNIQMRIVTDANVDNLMNMSYSDGVARQLKVDEPLETLIPTYVNKMIAKRGAAGAEPVSAETPTPKRRPAMPISEQVEKEYENESVELESDTYPNDNWADSQPNNNVDWTQYFKDDKKEYWDNKNVGQPNVARQPEYSPLSQPPQQPIATINGISVKPESLDKFNSMPQKDKELLMTYLKKTQQPQPAAAPPAPPVESPIIITPPPPQPLKEDDSIEIKDANVKKTIVLK